ncbi:MAG: Ig-like domain-containing protein [Flavobacteriaceae bacterium]
MNKLFFVLLFFTFYFLSPAQVTDDDYNWVAPFGGAQYSEVSALSTDLFGNIISVGHFSGTVDFDPDPLTEFNLTSQGSSDIFVSKQTPAGALVWAKSMGGSANDNAKSMVTDSSGNIYIVGYFQESGDFNPGEDEFILTSEGNDDVFIVKLDINGIFVWGGSMGSEASDHANSIAIDSNDDLYITGKFRHSMDVDLSESTYLIHSASFEDTFLIKIDTNSNLLWAKTFEGTTNWGNRIAINSLDQIYISGTIIGGPVDFNPGVGVFHLSASGNSSDAYVCKLDSDGNFITAGITGGINTASIPSFNAMKFDPNGNLVIAGRFNGTVNFDLTGGEDFQSVTHTTPDVFILKTDPNLNTIWFKQMGGNLEAAALGLEIDSQGNIYTTGHYRDNFMDFDPDPDIFHPILHTSYEEVFVSILDENGIFVDVFGMRGSGYERGKYLVFDKEENLYIGGFFEYNLILHPHFTLQSQGNRDSFLVKLGNIPNSPPDNFPPTANEDFSEVFQGGSVLIDLAENDEDPEASLDLSGIYIERQPLFGIITIEENGTVTYLNNGDPSTSDYFYYTITDIEGLTSNLAKVSITILPAENIPPVAVDDELTVNQGDSAVVNVVENDFDEDGSIDLTSITIITIPAHGTLVNHNDGTLSYTHDGSNSTSDSFQYTIQDNEGAASNVAEVIITIEPTMSVADIQIEPFKIYPNPATSLVTVNKSAAHITLFDMTGKEVMVSKNNSFDVSLLQSGVYIVKIQNDNQTESLFLIKQ